MGKRDYRAAAAAVLSVGVIACAHAQTAVAPQDGDRIEKVEVTATRSASAVDVQQVPAAITVLKPDNLTKYGLGNLTDIASLVPAMSVQEQGPGINNITMRGLVVRGIVPSEVQDASLVAVYIDDMPVTLKSSNPDLKVLDLERIEVLQGPQLSLIHI